MKGSTQEHELLISSVIRHAAENHGDREVVTREADGLITRSSYARVEQRARQLAAALTELGIRPGDRVATLAMNSYRHLECYYGISGMGAVLHTVNPRLFAEQISYIINHGQGRALLLDPCFLPLVESIAPRLEKIEHLIVLTEAALMPPAGERALLCYEQLLDVARGNYRWPSFDERTAASLCYTSGTTGQPKGVLYSHRSTLLHALVSLQADCFGLRSVDAVLPIVPMFHVHAWSMPYGCAMAGAKLVLPGNHMDRVQSHRPHSDRAGNDGAGRAHRVVDVGQSAARQRPVPALAAARGSRRRGAAAGDSRCAGTGEWSARHSCLGHDRNQPDRHRIHDLRES